MKFKLGMNPPNMTDLDACAKAMKIMKEVGFEACFLSVNPEKPEHWKALCNIAREIGLEIDELHAPFNNINRIWYDEPVGEPIVQMLMDSVDVTAACGVKKMVIHECANRVGPDMSNAGFARLRRIIAYGKEKGVRICVENLRRTNSLARVIEQNRDLGVGYCWDCGHELCYTPGVNHVAIFGDILACTHIHDNRGIYMGDDHMLPFDGQTDWEKKAELIKKSGYNGILCAELSKEKFYGDWPVEKFITEAYARMKKFEEMCE
ncbi:MAG: sugar phosphate isomerase/epimerase [Clostridia bacterium]|nr:sugar phosphate isomerase/epimerase [Clostridia bacterium]